MESQRAAAIAAETAASGEDVIAIVDDTTHHYMRWSANEVTANGAASTRTLTVIAVNSVDDGIGNAAITHRGHLDENTVRKVADAARAAALRAAPVASAPSLPGGHGTAGTPDIAMEEAPADAPPAYWNDLAADLGAAMTRADRRQRLLYGYAERQRRTTTVNASTGLHLTSTQAVGTVEAAAYGADGKASAWHGTAIPDSGEADVPGIHDELDRWLHTANRRVSLPPGRYDVVLSPSCVADLMARLYRAMSVTEATTGASPFGDGEGGTRIGERLTPASLTLLSDPAARGLSCDPFVITRSPTPTASVFDNGLPLRRTRWISDGVLSALVGTRTAAESAGCPFTPWIGNLVLTGAAPDRSLDEIVAETRRGLLVTSLWYLRDVDPRRLLITGLTRDGVYLIEDGEIVAATNDFRFNESLLGVLRRVTDVGTTVPTLPREPDDAMTRFAMPPLAVRDFTMSSVSEAP